MNITAFRHALEKRKGQREQIQNTIQVLKQQIKKLKQDLSQNEKAREIIREVGLATQKQLQFRISDITSLALEAVFSDPYTLEVDFVERRNRTECDLFFGRNGEKINPLAASGGGAVDVASFALRVASWTMALPHSRNTLVLDEPFRYLSAELLSRAGEMLKKISEELQLQILLVTHSGELMEYADKTFKVKQTKLVSHVTECTTVKKIGGEV